MSTRVIFPLFGSGGGGGDMSLYATGITMTMDNNYVISAQLTNGEGEPIGTEQTIDLPLESVVVGGSYDSVTKSIILTLDNGQSVTIPVGDLVSGLQSTIDSNNPLNVDYTTDGTTNKVYTATEKTKLAATRRVIDLTDMTQAELANFYTNYATLLGQNTYTINGYSFTTTTFQNSLYGTVLLIEYNSTYKDQDAGAANGTIDVGISVAYVLQDGTLVQVGSGTYNVPKTSALATVATSGSYNDLSNKPTIDVTAAGDNTFTGDNIFTKDTLIGDLSDISINLTVGTYGMPQIEGSDANTYKTFYINPDGIVFNDSNLGDDTGLGITLDSSTGDVTVYAGFGDIDFQASNVSVYGTPVATTDMLPTGTNDGTNWTTLTIGSDTYAIPSGGGSQWFGTQTQFDNLGTYDEDTDYYISDKLDYNTDIKNKPNLTVYATKTEVNTKNTEQDTEIAGKLSGHFMTQQEFDALGNNVPEGENYFIEGSTVQMVVTFTDQSTATYNVVVD